MESLVAGWLSGLAQNSLIVWDFDQTVLKIHAFGEGIEPEEVPGRWKHDVADLELFRAFVLSAAQKGVNVGAVLRRTSQSS